MRPMVMRAGQPEAVPVHNPRLRTPPDIVEKGLHLRRRRTRITLGPIHIVWCLERSHGITISKAGVSRLLRRHGLNR